MSNSDNEGRAIGALLLIVTIAIAIGSGILAWNWIDPHSFWGGIKFLIVWGVLSSIGFFIAMGLMSLFK